MQRRKAQRECRDLDAMVPRPDVQSQPLPSEILAELRSFTQKFNPVLFQAGINALRLPRFPTVWKDLVLMVMLQRLPDVEPQSRPWSRYRVDMVTPLPVEYVIEEMGGGENQFRQRKREQEKQHQEAGHLGTITAIICASCKSTNPPRLMHNVTFYGFGTHSFEAVDVGDDWLEVFKENVEKMCGRRTSELEL